MIHTQDSLNLARHITDEINHHSMHHHYYILFDIANTYPQDSILTYVEIGCYAGGSAGLMLQRPNTRVISIDLGHPIPQSIVNNNITKINKYNNSYSYLEGNSQSYEMVDRLKSLIDEIDILFIDGDHSYQGVINDFLLYEPLVKSGGYIIFDDYRDLSVVHNTSKPVDEIVESVKDCYEIIGTLPNTFGARPIELKDGNDFIIKKL